MARILVVTQHFRTGGLEAQIQEFCRFLSSRGNEIHLATSKDGQTDPVAKCLSGICLIDRWSPDGNIILEAASVLERYISKNRMDWAHLHPFESFFAGGLAASRAGIRYCVTLHSPASLTWFAGIPYRTFLTSCLLPDATRIFTVSLETANQVKSLVRGGRPVILPNAVDLNRYRVAERSPEGPWAIIARLDHEKIQGIQEALKLLAEARKKQLIQNVVVFGDGSGKTFVENWAKEVLDTEGWLTFRGHAESLPERLKKGWAGVLGMGRVALEAAAMNLPVFLVGYDGVKGLVTRDHIDRLAICNFSGRGERNIDDFSFQEVLRTLEEQESRYRLREWVLNKANASKVWQQYKKEMSVGIKKKPKYLWAMSFETLCRNLGQESIYSLHGTAQMLESVVPSTGRTVGVGSGLLVELLKIADEKKNIDTELASHRQALSHERAWSAERIHDLEAMLISLKMERDQALQSEAMARQALADETAQWSSRVTTLEQEIVLLNQRRDQALQSEAMARQALADQAAQWSNRVTTLEQEIVLLNQKKDQALQRESEHHQMLLNERTKFEERIRGLDGAIHSLEGEWHQLIESEALLRQTSEKEKLKWQEEILNLKQAKTLVDQKLAETEQQLSRQEGMAQSLQQEKMILEGDISKLRQEREGIFKTNAIHQQQANEFRDKLLQLIQAVEEARQSFSWRMMRLLRRLRLQAVQGGLGERVRFVKWTIRKILKRPSKPADPSFDPLPENLIEFLSQSQGQIPTQQEEGAQKDQLLELMLAVETARQTLSWRMMRLLRRFREWVLLGNVKGRWQFCKWVARKVVGKKETPGSPSFDPIGDENFYDLGSLQRAIENVRKIRSWRAMCFLRGLRKHLIQGNLKDLWHLRKFLGQIFFEKKEGWEGWILFDPIPKELMRPRNDQKTSTLPISEGKGDGRQTYIFALDRGWGDILMSLPVAQVLKKKERTCRVVYFLEAPEHLPLVQNNPCIDEVYFSRDLITSYPDAEVFDIRHTPSDWHQSRMHITDMIANHFRVKVHTRRPSLYIPDNEATRKTFELPDLYAVAHLQSTTREKDWNLSNWTHIFDHLYRQYGMKTVIVGGPDEDTLSRWEKDYVFDFRGETSLSETVNIIKYASVFIGIDSGPMHIAGALNIPSVVLWGNTSPIICGIHSDIVYNMEPERKCQKGGHWACHFFPCPEKELCINHISFSDVIRCVDDCLSIKKGVLVVHVGKNFWDTREDFKTGEYAFIQSDAFTARALNESVYSSHSEYVAILSSDYSDPCWDEIGRMAEIAKMNRLGIVSLTCLRYVSPGNYGEYKNNAITKCHRGSSGFIFVRRNVLTRIGGFDPKLKSVAGCLDDFYFKALLLNEPVWYVESSLPVSPSEGDESWDEKYLLKKWGGVDLASLHHLESVSFTDHRQRDTTLFLIFSHCSFDFNGGGQRWDALAKLASRNGYHLLYIDELMKGEETDPIVKDFLGAQMPRKMVFWARPVPRYKKYFDLFRQLKIPQIYDCIDDWRHMMVEDPAVPLFEEDLFEQSAMVTTTALSLREKIKQTRNGENIPLIPNGADPEIFDYRRILEAPPDLKKASLTLGYFGTLAEWWIADDLLCDLAAAYGDQVAINLIGPCKQEYRDLFSKFKNIAILGQKRHDELPPYLSQFDVALIPFKVIPVTESTSPVKAYEYLFAGKPVVSTDLPEVRHLPYTYSSKTNSDFLDNVLKASRVQMNPAELDRFRMLHSWESRFKELLTQIQVANPPKRFLDIILVSYNTKDLTESCIQSIERHTTDYQLFVVDNHSTDGSVERLEEFCRQGRLRLIKNQRNEGYGRAVNAAFKQGSSEYIVILNSDIEVLSSWAEPLIEALASDRTVGAVAPKLIGPNSGIDCAGVWGTNARPLIRFSENNDFGKFSRVLENVYISGACIVTRRSTFSELGQFDERFFFYFEDMDFCFKARERGLRILYIPYSVVVHHRAKASDSIQEQVQKWYTESQRLFLEKWNRYLADQTEYPLQ